MPERVPEFWNRRVVMLPSTGTLLFATDLQGNWDDYARLKDIYSNETKAGNTPILVFAGDMVHGPSPDMNQPGAWPEYLGTPYQDRSRDIITDYERWSRTARTFSLMGNHEHSHIGGPVCPKFYDDEASVLDEALGSDRARVHDFIKRWPLLAVAPCGAVLLHGSPAATEPTLADFEKFEYEGYQALSIPDMMRHNTLGALLWARSATQKQAQEFLRTCSTATHQATFAAFGHDIVREGYTLSGPEQICLSTSFGLLNENKVYLRLDLSRKYASAQTLRDGEEIVKLYP